MLINKQANENKSVLNRRVTVQDGVGGGGELSPSRSCHTVIEKFQEKNKLFIATCDVPSVLFFLSAQLL